MPEKQLKKLDPRAKPYILVGYGSNQYKLLDPSTRKTIWCRDVYILERKYIDSLEDAKQFLSDDQLVIEDWDEEQEIEAIELETEATEPEIETTELNETPTGAPLIGVQREQDPQNENMGHQEPINNQNISPYADLISQLQQAAEED